MHAHGCSDRARGALVLLFLLVWGGQTDRAIAQEAPATITLGEALKLAHENNPDYLAQLNDAGPADWAVREAFGNLLPGASVSTGMQYQASGTQRFGTLTGGDVGLSTSPSYYLSSYNVGLNYRLSGSTLLAPGQQKANRRATEANIDAARFDLDRNVTFQYLAVLRAQDGVTLAEQELARAEENLKLAQARVTVGSAIPMEAKQAEVDRGRARVSLLQARNAVVAARLQLMQLLGIDMQTSREIRLTTTFAVTDVPWTQQELVDRALQAHPQLRAARASQSASSSALKMARTAYLPSLNFSAGWSGYTRQVGSADYLVQQAEQSAASSQQSCQLLNNISAGLSTPLPGTPADCSAFDLTAEDRARIRNGNNVFPFDFTKQPFTLSLTVSLPLFDGFGRERQVEVAKAAAQDARYRERAQELSIRTEVATAYQDVLTARQSVDLEETNRALAEDQLRLARERYRIGSASFLELQDAETAKAQADRAYLDAVYAFHEGIATLEAAVGMPLRQPGGGQE